MTLIAAPLLNTNYFYGYPKHRYILIFYLLTLYYFSVAIFYLYIQYSGRLRIDTPAFVFKRSWGGFDEQPTSEQCYRQERTGMLLAVLLGFLGIDQWYAHHWVLAVFKLLTAGGLGIWAFVDYKETYQSLILYKLMMTRYFVDFRGRLRYAGMPRRVWTWG
jgi:hypothetical protein